MSTERPLTFYSQAKPSSYDPLKYDFFENHVSQSLVHLRLTTIYKGHGEAMPQIASHWAADEGGKTWRFTIRRDLVFGNGERLDARSVALSLIRVFWFLKQHDSKSLLISNLKGVDQLVSATSVFEGITYSGDEVIIRTLQSFPEMPETLAFGIFSIIPPKAFDALTGDIIDKKLLLESSGPYELIHAAPDKSVFRVKTSFPSGFTVPNRFEKIVIKSGELQASDDVDLAYAQSDAPHFDANYKFIGRGARNILYIALPGWGDPLNAFGSLANRRKLRSAFFKKLDSTGYVHTSSFFPKVMPGISEPKESSEAASIESEINLEGRKIIFNDPRPSASPFVNAAASAFEQALVELGMEPVGVKGHQYPELHAELDPLRKKRRFGAMLLTSGISVEDPDSDIRLMFSKEGIWLPDSDGKIHSELKKVPIVAQRVNELLFDQATIIPIGHYDKGLWAKRALGLKNYNGLLAPGELQWIAVED